MPHFTGGKLEARGSFVTCPRFHRTMYAPTPRHPKTAFVSLDSSPTPSHLHPSFPAENRPVGPVSFESAAPKPIRDLTNKESRPTWPPTIHPGPPPAPAHHSMSDLLSIYSPGLRTGSHTSGALAF